MITYQGRRAWRIETAELRITILECGGHVAEIVYKPVGDVNPLWIQNRPTIDSDQFDPAIHAAVYGTDSEAKLISGLLGHNLCFPFWGTPSASEEAAGMTFHGETNILRWEGLRPDAHTLQLAVTLPNAAIRFEREVRSEGQVIYFSEVARNLSAWDRPVGWCEHVTFGPPFLNAGGTAFAANVKRGFRTADPSGSEFAWPQGEGDVPYMLSGFYETAVLVKVFFCFSFVAFLVFVFAVAVCWFQDSSRASIRTLDEPLAARCLLGSDVDELGLLSKARPLGPSR